MRLLNATISAVKDANPKIVLMALESVNILVNDYKEIFQPSLNMTFDILLSKFGDSKVRHDVCGSYAVMQKPSHIGESLSYNHLYNLLNVACIS